jgi:hypothetical protein
MQLNTSYSKGSKSEQRDPKRIELAVLCKDLQSNNHQQNQLEDAESSKTGSRVHKRGERTNFFVRLWADRSELDVRAFMGRF